MLFEFRVIDKDGATLEGDVSAASEEQAAWMLRKEYPGMRSITFIKGQPTGKVRAIRVKSADMVIFYRRLAVMLEAGVNIDRALLFLSESADGPIAQLLEQLQREVASGSDLLDVLSKPEMRQVFSPLARGLIGTGMKTGALAESLTRLAEVTERRYAQRRAFLSALSYPAVLLLAIVSLAALFLVFVAPGEIGIYSNLGGELPWVTQVLVNLSDGLRSPLLWGGLAAVLVVGVPLARHALRPGTRARQGLDRRLLKLPFFGSLWEKSAASEVLHIWSASLRVGVPLSEGIALSLPTITNSELLSRLNQAHLGLREGEDFGEALRQYEVFPQLVTSMISLGFESGQLDGMLQRVSELYEEDVNSAIAQVAKVTEPILLGVAGFLAGFVAVACLMPMLQLGNSL